MRLFAIFNSKHLGNPIEVEITDFVAEGTTYFDSCYLPHEVLQREGKFTIGIYGYILNGDESLQKRLSLKPIECNVVKGSYDENAVGTDIPTPDVFEIYFNKINEYEQQINDLFENANESLKKIKHFNSVADMKADTTLLNTYYVKTLGYYEANDGGGADYLIREALETDVDDGGSVHFLSNGFVAELIVGDCVNPLQFGAHGDGVNDDTVAIQKAIDSGFKVVLNQKKKYMFSKTLNITKPIILEGDYADLTYTGTETAIYFNAENIESHKRDMGVVNNIMLHSPNADKAIKWNHAIKTVLRNIKIYDFKHYGIYFQTAGYESRFENIYLVGRKTNNTVGIYGNIADMDFGALYGMNVQKFMEITGTATNIELVHAWCANLSIFEDEPTMSEETYNEWFNKTVLFHFKQPANDYPLNFNYVYADTYNTVIKWESYHRNTSFKTLSLRGSNKLIESTEEYNYYTVYIGIENLFANLTMLSEEYHYPTISKVNNFKVSKARTRIIGDKTVKIPVDRIISFNEQVTGAYNRVLNGVVPLPFIYSQYNFGGDAKTGFPYHNTDNGSVTYEANLSGTYYVRLFLQSAPIQYGSTFCYVANDNSI